VLYYSLADTEKEGAVMEKEAEMASDFICLLGILELID